MYALAYWGVDMYPTKGYLFGPFEQLIILLKATAYEFFLRTYQEDKTYA
jgi:hypothetical protein